VFLARKALPLFKEQMVMFRVLAAALAESGDFEEAILWQERVVQDPLFKDSAEEQMRLRGYRKKQPYRE
jgi:hypothetical protein